MSTSIFFLLSFIINAPLSSTKILRILETNNIVHVSFTRNIKPTPQNWKTKISHFVYRVNTNF